MSVLRQTSVLMTIRAKLRVLVPGAGLGRLAYDIAGLGQPERSAMTNYNNTLLKEPL